jgi:hypothetical protein
MKPFYEEQRFPLRRIGPALATPPCILLGLLIWQVVLGHPVGKQPMSNGNVIGWTIFLWLVFFRLLTVRLVTKVSGSELQIAFRGLWRARRVRLSDIESVQTVTIDPQRNTPGRTYIANGNRGVLLKLANGSTLVIGSQKPEELAGVLNKLPNSRSRT